MANTLSMDASHKVKGGGSHVSSFLHHIARDVDDRQGVPRQHANVNVDRARTHLNRTVVNDGQGGFRQCEAVDELAAHLDRRLATVKKPPRDGAVILRPLVLQLDPQWYDKHMPDWRDGEWTDEHQRYADGMLQWAADTFGQENIVGASWHMDETSPQLQVIFSPVTTDGRLSQKDWFQGPAALRAMHDDFRTYMQGVGYDVSMDRSARSRERLSSTEFARKAEQIKADAYLAADARKDAALYLNAAKRAAAAERADWAEPDEHGQDEGPKRRHAREKATEEGYAAGKTKGQADAAADRQKAAQELQRAVQARAALDRAHADWKAEPPTRAALLDEWLDLPLKNGGTRRDRFDAFTARVADEWLKAHADDVSALDDDDLALLVQGGTTALDDALAEAQREKGLR